jgi:hypothetical protein
MQETSTNPLSQSHISQTVGVVLLIAASEIGRLQIAFRILRAASPNINIYASDTK